MNSTEKPTIGTSTAHWFGRGLIGGIMLIAAANALSYFFRTDGLADLIGPDQNLVEAIGFPFEIWRENHVYFGSMYLDYSRVGLNLLVGLGLGTVFGLIAIGLKDQFNRWVSEFEAKQATNESQGYQFTIKSLMGITTVAAMVVAALTAWNGTKEVLLVIYFLGPLCLILIAMLPNQIHWHHRVVILTILATVMIGIAVATGIKLKVPLDRIMLGIFVSWTPQSAFAAFLLTAGLVCHSLLIGMTPGISNENCNS